MLEPVKDAFGQFMGRYYASLVPTTKPLEAFVRRGLAKSMAWAPGRMIDSVEEMLALWMKSDKDDATTRPPDLPAIMVAMAKDYMPTGRDYTRQIADMMHVVIDKDPKERVFGLRAAAGDVRTQIVILATDEPSAKSLAAQFLLFLDATPNRRFEAAFKFAGMSTDWPVQIDSPDVGAQAITTEAKNLTVLAIDISLRVEIPLFSAPREGEPNDGKGVPETDDPAGYPVVGHISIHSSVAGPRGGSSRIRDYNVDWHNDAGQEGSP